MDVRDCRVAVTGGAGFIGSHLVDRLLDAGSEVAVIDDFSSGHYRNLKRHEHDARVRIFQADVRNEARLRELLEGVQLVFHLATRSVRSSLVQPSLVHEVNATGTLNVLKAAATVGVRRLLYCSSSEVNGTADLVPMPEDYHFRPETIYGASKLTGEYYAQVFHRAGWLETVIARPHNTYGPREHYEGETGEVIPRFILWALAGRPLLVFGDGGQTRDFTYVTETAEMLLKLLQCDQAAGKTFNVCRGEEVSVLEIAEKIRRSTGSKSRLEHLPGRPSDVLRLFGDPSRLRETLDTSPSISIDDGLTCTIDWFRQNVTPTADVLASLEPRNWCTPAREPWLDQVSQRRRLVAAA